MVESTNVKSLERALVLLEELADRNIPLGVNELAKGCQMSPATAFRILQTLKNHRFVYQDGEDKYRPGCRMTFIDAERCFLSELRDVAQLVMAPLSAAEHEAMNLAVRQGSSCYILGQSRTDRIVDYVPPVGTVLPLHASACGKVLLAALPETRRAELLDSISLVKMTECTVCDKSRLADELITVKNQGFALDAHESQLEGFCIAVPVFSDNSSETIAALSFSGFIGRRSVDQIDYYLALLKAASSSITARLFGA